MSVVPIHRLGEWLTRSSLQLISEIRYLNTPIPFSYSADGNSLTIAQLPTTLVAAGGQVPLEIRLTDSTKTSFAVTVNP
jgi:hypothetical protein